MRKTWALPTWKTPPAFPLSHSYGCRVNLYIRVNGFTGGRSVAPIFPASTLLFSTVARKPCLAKISS
jgi:hypothetical protein